MEHSRKMILVPEDTIQSKNDNKKRIEKDLDKIQKLLNIILKIAIKQGYNEEFKLLDKYGKPIEYTDIVNLLNHSLTHEKILYGEEDFIRLLYESKVDPNWIVNENVRAKLMNYNNLVRHESPTAHLSSPQIEGRIIKRPNKRNISEVPETNEMDTENIGPTNAKIQKENLNPWQVPLPSSDDEDE